MSLDESPEHKYVAELPPGNWIRVTSTDDPPKNPHTAPFLLSNATGMVVRKRTDSSPADYTGTCARFVLPHVAITAKHCVPEQPESYVVRMGVAAEIWNVVRIERNPKSDIAILIGDPSVPTMPGAEFASVKSDAMIEGGDFFAFGFPAEGPGSVGRFFKGHFQRYFHYKDTYGDSYFAGELSVPAPNGLSGAPIVNPRKPRELLAIVTGNQDTYAIEHSHEEFDDKGNVTRAEIRRIITYGISAMLTMETTWINGIVDEVAR